VCPQRARGVADLDALRGRLHAMLNDSNPSAYFKAMIDGVRVDACDHIEPTFRVPTVRIESGYMELVDLKSNRVARLPGGRMSLDNRQTHGGSLCSHRLMRPRREKSPRPKHSGPASLVRTSTT
jgi:hypothetical protein